MAQYEIMVSIKDYEHRKEPDGTSREQPRGPEEVRITDGASDDKLEFGAENRTDLVESPDPSDEVAKALEKQYPNTRRLRFVSDQPVPCQQAPRKLLGLYRGDKKLVEALPNPPHRNYAKISVSGIQQPRDSLFQVVEFLTASS
uniref:Uncharacterized protein n=1 Tax=Candidatus Kentrum sp. LFY TaxID=2126342 RepID=A0A450V4I0_9GAMM|nr:MAG: hypothetical protein BECKLFY1418A_GA0070994_110310 [Candidatus Kentron sp. LFY]